jgi:hypothetical protein
MIEIYVGSALDPKKVIVPQTTTPEEIFRQNNIVISKTVVVMLNSRRLGDAEMKLTLSELKVNDGDALILTEKLNSN